MSENKLQKLSSHILDYLKSATRKRKLFFLDTYDLKMIILKGNSNIKTLIDVEGEDIFDIRTIPIELKDAVDFLIKKGLITYVKSRDMYCVTEFYEEPKSKALEFTLKLSLDEISELLQDDFFELPSEVVPEISPFKNKVKKSRKSKNEFSLFGVDS